MFTIIERRLFIAALLVSGQCIAAGADDRPVTYGFGAPATTDDPKNFVSPLADGRGLPEGSGSAEQGKARRSQDRGATPGLLN